MPPIGLVDIREQHAEVRDAFFAKLNELFDAGAFVLGRYVEEFEAAFSGAIGVGHAVGVNSGTDALLIALDIVRLRHGPGEVITTPFTFFATVESILQAGHRVRFADIEEESFNLSPPAVQAAAGPETVAVMPVHLFGRCADMDALRVGDVPLIEDAAQAMGATYKARPAGALGMAAGFSFYPTKNLGGAGDAGALTTDDDEVAALARSLRAHGEARGDGGRTYHYERLGRNSRLDGIQAALLTVKLERWAAWQEQRDKNALFYDEALAGIDGLRTPPRTEHGRHVYHQYAIRSDRRDGLRAHLAGEEILTNVFYPQPLHTQPALRELGLEEGQFPEAERATREVLSLPVHAHLAQSDLERVVAAIRAFHR